VARGNVPDWLRELRRIERTAETAGRRVRLTFWVMPDYLSVGSGEDYFYVPLSPLAAQQIADLAGGSLPTAAVVDAAWSSARVRLIPVRFPPGEEMWSFRHFERHNNVVQAQRRQRRAPPGTFVAGHKVDVVIATTPAAEATSFALYGWHHRDGTPIQPLYPLDAATRPHFSMGVRLVHRRVLLDGAEVDLLDLLRDPELAGVL
jgi:hypothetical protein